MGGGGGGGRLIWPTNNQQTNGQTIISHNYGPVASCSVL